MPAPRHDPREPSRSDPATALAGLLGRRFGDGLVYLQGQADRHLLAEARERGFVSADGHLTRAGRRYWQRRAER